MSSTRHCRIFLGVFLCEVFSKMALKLLVLALATLTDDEEVVEVDEGRGFEVEISPAISLALFRLCE